MGGWSCVEYLSEFGCLFLVDYHLASVGGWSTDATTVVLIQVSVEIYIRSLLLEPTELVVVLTADRILLSLLQFLKLERLSGEVCESAQVNVGLHHLE